MQTIVLNGTGVAASAPAASLSPASIPFANQTVNTTSGPSNITLSNTGNAVLTGIAISITGANPTDFAQTNNCGTTLAASAACTISITFTPATVTNFSALLSVADSASGSPQTAALTGSGAAVPASIASLTPAGLSFPGTNVGGTSTAQVLTLSNTGNALLNITGISIAGANPADFTETNTCGATLAASAGCTISVTFSPLSASSFTAAVSVVDNATGSPQSATLGGTGMPAPVPQVVLSPASLIFAGQNAGSSSTAQTITLSNPGGATLSITSITVAGSGSSAFAETTTCGSILAAGASCTISVTFTPTTGGALAAAVSIADNASVSAQTVPLSGTGMTPATFTIAATPATQVVGPGGAATFTINVNSSGGIFSSGVGLSVSGLPAGAAATFCATSVTPGAAGGFSMLTIQTGTQYGSRVQSRGSLAPLLAVLLLSPAWWLRRKRGFAHLLLVVLLLVGASLGLSSCSGGYFGPAPQSFTLTVTGAADVIQQSTTVTLNVQ